MRSNEPEIPRVLPATIGECRTVSELGNALSSIADPDWKWVNINVGADFDFQSEDAPAIERFSVERLFDELLRPLNRWFR